MKSFWYVVKAIPGRESKCQQIIERQVKQAELTEYVSNTLIPVERMIEVKRGKKVSVEHKLYPGYIYVEMQARPDVLECIRNVDGVIGFLGSDPRTPTALEPDEVATIMKIVEADSGDEQRAAMIQIPYSVGDKVKVKEGTFAGMDGDVEEINAPKGTLRVLITVFGRQTPVELEVWQVEELV
ncbi:MAG: transcription termination/antitermination factor NusG [Planctomycetes bacterium]|nr:transcription termination/antitermination factor NusG [Planctomycetota bacterium]